MGRGVGHGNLPKRIASLVSKHSAQLTLADLVPRVVAEFEAHDVRYLTKLSTIAKTGPCTRKIALSPRCQPAGISGPMIVCL